MVFIEIPILIYGRPLYTHEVSIFFLTIFNLEPSHLFRNRDQYATANKPNTPAT